MCRRPRGWWQWVRGRLSHPLTLRPDICFSDARLCPGPSSLGRPQALSVPALGQWFVPPYHGRQAGNVFDRILDLLFGHLDQRAVLVLRWQRLRPVPRDPGVQLQRMTGGVRGRCSWLPEAGERSQGCRDGRGSGLRSGMQESRQARRRVGVSRMGGHVEKVRDREWEGATGLGCAWTRFSGPRSWQK